MGIYAYVRMYVSIMLFNKLNGETPHGIVANILDSNIVLSEFKP